MGAWKAQEKNPKNKFHVGTFAKSSSGTHRVFPFRTVKIQGTGMGLRGSWGNGLWLTRRLGVWRKSRNWLSEKTMSHNCGYSSKKTERKSSKDSQK